MIAVLALFAVLFPAPLHLTREVTDPITGGKSIVEEYCHGNRVVAVTGKRTAIAEYDKGVVTVIDFEAGTYSVTKFDDLAKAWAGPERADSADSAAPMKVKGDERHKLSRDAVEVLLGLAYPARRDAAAEAAVAALRSKERRAVANAAGVENAAADYALPLEHVVQVDVGGETVEVRNTVVRIGSELAPAEVLAVPPGARLVESTVVGARRMLDELDGKRQ